MSENEELRDLLLREIEDIKKEIPSKTYKTTKVRLDRKNSS